MWSDQLKVEVLCIEKYRIRKESNLAFQKKNLTPALEHSSGNGMVCSCFAASGSRDLALIEGIMDSLREQYNLLANSTGGCQGICL